MLARMRSAGPGCRLGVGLILGDNNNAGAGASHRPWRSGLAGVLLAALLSVVAMGGCSWWLISMQKYKNAINGPWDLARPIIISRRLWEDD